jgi:ABC-type glycerol-3-phosphate transport system substrate-binding protein
MDRRRYLATAGLAASSSFAGCVADLVGPRRREPADGVDGPVTVEWLVPGPGLTGKSGRELVATLHDLGLPESVKVETDSGPLTPNYDLIAEQVLREGRETPTVLPASDRWLRTLARGPFQSLDRLLPAATREDLRTATFDPVARAAVVDGTLRALPVHVWTPLVFYRRDRVREAGWDLDARGWQRDPPTWRAFAAVVADALADSAARYGYAFGTLLAGERVLPETMRSWGGAYFGDPATHLYGPLGDRPVTVAARPVADALRMLRAFVHGPDAGFAHEAYPAISPRAALPPEPWDEARFATSFATGETVAIRGPPRFAGRFGDDPVEAFPVPYATPAAETDSPLTGGSRPTYRADSFVVNPYAPPAAQAAAGELLRVVASDAFRRVAARDLGWLPPVERLYADDTLEGTPVGPHRETVRTALSSAVPLPVTTAWPDQRDAVDRAVDDVVGRSLGLEQTLSDLREELVRADREAAAQTERTG